MERVTDPADPRRCKGASPSGQCMNMANEGCDYCSIHGRRKLGPTPSKRMYMLANAAERVDQLADHEAVKTLREEIAITRMMVEHFVNQIHQDIDYQLQFPAIQQGINTIHRLVKDCHVLEQNLGILLSKEAVLEIAKGIVAIIHEHLSQSNIPYWEELVGDISEAIMNLVASASNESVVKSVKLIEDK